MVRWFSNRRFLTMITPPLSKATTLPVPSISAARNDAPQLIRRSESPHQLNQTLRLIIFNAI
jgi:hypothetical protein